MVRRGGNLSEKLVKKKMKIGLDVGSTTLKCVVYSEEGEPVFQEYERHYSQIAEKASGMLLRIQEKFPELKKASLCVSGSAGMGLAEDLDIPFVQEVYATRTATKKYLPQADVVIELGGRGREDLVPHRLDGGADERLLRRGHRGVYRPDGHPVVHHPHGAQRDRRGERAHLQHRLPVRGVRQE